MTRSTRALALIVVAAAAACGDQAPPTSPVPPLTLSCPASIAIEGATGPGQAVTWSAPLVSGARAPFDVQCQPASGSTFPLGTTAVTCAVTDGLGRSASCAFDVTLAARMLGVSTVLAFGDSVTAGFNGNEASLSARVARPELAYPIALQRLLAEGFPDQPVTVVNAGVGGERASCATGTTACAVERLPGTLDDMSPDVVILLTGYNDLFNDQEILVDGTSIAIDHVVDAMRELIEISKDAGARIVMVATLTPGRPHVPPANDRTIADHVLREANAGLAAVAAAEGAVLVDAYAAFAGQELALISDDGLHPTELGYGVLGEVFYQALLEATAGSGGTAR